jgi:hypothetical protein
LAEQKPEAAYFTAEHGHRGGVLVVNIDDVSQIPALTEPWFLTANANVEFVPNDASGEGSAECRCRGKEVRLTNR